MAWVGCSPYRREGQGFGAAPASRFLEMGSQADSNGPAAAASRFSRRIPRTTRKVMNDTTAMAAQPIHGSTERFSTRDSVLTVGTPTELRRSVGRYRVAASPDAFTAPSRITSGSRMEPSSLAQYPT